MRPALGLALTMGGLIGSLGGPRVTILNAGLSIDYPRVQALSLLAAALGLALLGWSLSGRWRALLGLASLLMSGIAGARAVYHLEAGESAIADQRLFGWSRISWSEVGRVDAGPALVLIWGPGDSQVRIDTARFSPDQRAMLDRTISRHVREAQERARQLLRPEHR